MEAEGHLRFGVASALYLRRQIQWTAGVGFFLNLFFKVEPVAEARSFATN
jgi:hypothetical protein